MLKWADYGFVKPPRGGQFDDAVALLSKVRFLLAARLTKVEARCWRRVNECAPPLFGCALAALAVAVPSFVRSLVRSFAPLSELWASSEPSNGHDLNLTFALTLPSSLPLRCSMCARHTMMQFGGAKRNCCCGKRCRLQGSLRQEMQTWQKRVCSLEATPSFSLKTNRIFAHQARDS